MQKLSDQASSLDPDWILLLRRPSIPVSSMVQQQPFNNKEIQPIHPKGNQSWIFIGKIDAEAEASILWPPDVKHRLFVKDHYAGKDWRQEEKGMTEDKMAWCHHWFDRHEFEQALGVGDGQGSLACCSPWGCKESDKTEWLNWTEFLKSALDPSWLLEFQCHTYISSKSKGMK